MSVFLVCLNLAFSPSQVTVLLSSRDIWYPLTSSHRLISLLPIFQPHGSTPFPKPTVDTHAFDPLCMPFPQPGMSFLILFAWCGFHWPHDPQGDLVTLALGSHSVSFWISNSNYLDHCVWSRVCLPLTMAPSGAGSS